MLDCPGIDLETTFELEAALGEILDKRIVLGLERGEVPLVVDSEKPFSWRLHREGGQSIATDDSNFHVEDREEVQKSAEESTIGDILAQDKGESTPAQEEDSIELAAEDYSEKVADILAPLAIPADTISALEWAGSVRDVYGKVIKLSLEGLSVEEVASECKLPKSSIPSLINYGLNRRPELREDAFAEVFKQSDFSMSEFEKRYGEPSTTYRYLSLVYGDGLFELPQSKIAADNQQASKNVAEPAQSKKPTRKQIKQAILSIAKANTEYSTNYFFDALPELRKAMRTGTRKQFNSALRKAFSGDQNVSFPTGYIIRFGSADRDTQILELLRELQPISEEDLIRAYKERYGVGKTTVFNWLFCIRQHHHGDMYFIKAETPLEARQDSEVTKADNCLGRSAANQNESNPTRTNSTPRFKGDNDSRTIALRRQAAVEIQLRSAVNNLRKWGFEYSTDVFFRKLGSLPIELGAFSEESFFQLMREAYRDAPGVSFPMSHIVRFGGSDLEEQMKLLIDEIEPLSYEDLASAFFERYGLERNYLAKKVFEQNHENQHPAITTPTSTIIDSGHERSTSEAIQKRKEAVSSKQAKRLRTAIESLCTWNAEYSTDHFFRELGFLVSDLGIQTKDEFYRCVKNAYRGERDVTFPMGHVVVFGKCNVAQQMRTLLKETLAATAEELADEYELRYGLRRDYAAQVVIKNPVKSDIASNGISVVAESTAEETGFRPAVAGRAVKRSTSASNRNKGSNSRTGQRGSASRAQSGRHFEYLDYLKSELTTDCCDRKLIAERFHARFPEGPQDPFDEDMLRILGFKPKGKTLLFKNGVSHDEYFRKLIIKNDMFRRGDKGFENAIFNDPQFRRILRQNMREYKVIEYEKDSFISAQRLCSQMDVNLSSIRRYTRDVTDQLGAPVPFTIWSLRNTYGISNPLDTLVTEGGMSDYLFESLFDIDPYVQCCTLAGRRVFLETEGAFNASNFIECLIEMKGPMELDDLIDLLNKDYGVVYHELPLRHTISASSLYYDDITDSVFNSRREWEEMVERELA